MGERSGADRASSSAPASPWQVDLQWRGSRIAIAVLAGLACGALVGGVAGRLAMLVLRLTSSPSLYGLRTDDNFVIGRFSRSSLFLLALTAVLGAVGGLFYLMARGWLPRPTRPWAMGLFALLVGGSLVVEPGGRDFSALDPLWLAVFFFLALPATYGFLVSVIIERLLERSAPERDAAWLGVLTLCILALCGPPGILLLTLLVTVWALERRWPALGRLWHSSGTSWFARVLLLAITVLTLGDVVGNLKEIL